MCIKSYFILKNIIGTQPSCSTSGIKGEKTCKTSTVSSPSAPYRKILLTNVRVYVKEREREGEGGGLL